MNTKIIHRIIVISIMITNFLGILLFEMNLIEMGPYGWAISILTFCLSFVWVVFDWLDYKYLRDNEIYKNHLEYSAHKRNIEQLKKIILKDEDKEEFL